MSEIQIDDATRSKIGEFVTQVRVVDSNGRTVGYLLPPELHLDLLRAWVTGPFREEEAERSRQEYRAGRRFSTAEALAFLRQLDADEPAA